MTQSTEQERAEFLEQVGHLIMDGTIETRSTKRAGISFACGNLHAAFMVWQAARRAPAAPVPQGWRLVPVEPTKEMIAQACKDHGYPGGSRMVYRDGYRSMLAAAPQPPEVAQSNSAEFDGVKTNVAPVQLPEPVAYMYHDAPTLDDYIANERAGIPLNSAFISVKRMPHYRNETPLYTAPKPQYAAPLKLPEPAGWIDDGGMVFWNDGRKPNDGEIIYTEQQVREILKANGINVKKSEGE